MVQMCNTHATASRGQARRDLHRRGNGAVVRLDRAVARPHVPAALIWNGGTLDELNGQPQKQQTLHRVECALLHGRIRPNVPWIVRLIEKK